MSGLSPPSPRERGRERVEPESLYGLFCPTVFLRTIFGRPVKAHHKEITEGSVSTDKVPMNIDGTVHFDYPLLFGFDFFSWILFSKKYFIFLKGQKEDSVQLQHTGTPSCYQQRVYQQYKVERTKSILGTAWTSLGFTGGERLERRDLRYKRTLPSRTTCFFDFISNAFRISVGYFWLADPQKVGLEPQKDKTLEGEQSKVQCQESRIKVDF